ncbi:hypothetical protein BaRGS_00008975 [Batillaria attramentaria]|uniref:Large ribosomal subunit protein mL40 n=1 Tax=Batillaria attramentaria TaxID=370345 RepID=A0ABD0LLK5_9CAEN
MASRALQSSLGGLILRISRLSVQTQVTPDAAIRCQRCLHTQMAPLLFHASEQLWGSPLKKKKKVDPAVLLARETKRKRKIERQMRRLEKLGRRLKPVDEIEGDPKLRNELQLRRREPAVLTFEESESRALLQKEWSRYKFRQFTEETAMLSSLLASQERALEELKFESPELYQMALQTDDGLVPFEMKGPTATPPIKGFDAVDGEYIDVTKTFD